MKKTIVLASSLEPWSIQLKSGAPSLYETLKGYSDAGFLTTYITYEKSIGITNLSHSHNIDLQLPGLTTIRVPKKQAPSFLGSRISGKVNRVYYESWTLLDALRDYLDKQETPPTILYAYEAQAIHAISRLEKKHKNGSIIVNRYQGTILGGRYKQIIHCLRKYEMFRVLKDKADKYIMTNDGTLGDKALKYWNKSVGNNNLLFLRNGFNFENFLGEHNRKTVIESLGLAPNNFYAFTVSRLTLWKRVDRAIDLIEHFHRAHPELHLIVVGDGEHKSKLQEFAEEMKVTDRVHFIGAQSRKKVAELMASLDLFLSLYDVSNLGNPLFEAMICGQCVVTLDNGSTKEVITNNQNGIIVEPDDKENLNKEFGELLKNENKRNRLKISARNWANENLQSWPDRMKEEVEWVLK
ncbi:MAG: glycosyltransferase [Flavobacteriaceae bacterium]|nr:glycosyltransferase [Flavobacteriaceae bacterium]